MFCQACEHPAAVFNIENGQINLSAMERPHSGVTLHGIVVSPVPGKLVHVLNYSGDNQAITECVQTKYGSSWP